MKTYKVIEREGEFLVKVGKKSQDGSMLVRGLGEGWGEAKARQQAHILQASAHAEEALASLRAAMDGDQAELDHDQVSDVGHAAQDAVDVIDRWMVDHGHTSEHDPAAWRC